VAVVDGRMQRRWL